MDGFARRKEQSKEDIRKAAWELFSQFGVEKVSMVDIARKAGVSQATIYNNFGSKEALVREFVAAMIERLVNRVQEVLAPAKPYQEKMAAFIRLISEMVVEERSSAIDIPVFASNANLQNDPEIRKIRQSAQEKLAKALVGLVKEGRDQGQVDADLSDDAIGLYFMGFMDLFTNPQLQRHFAHDPQIVQDLGKLMIYGLSGGQKFDRAPV